MSTDNPVEQLANDVRSLQSELDSLQSKVRLASARDTLEDLESAASGLAQRVKELRARGYVFEKGLEDQATDLANRWSSLRPMIVQQIDSQAAALALDMNSLESQMAQLNAWASDPDVARPMVTQLQQSLSALASKTDAVERSMTGMYDQFKDQLDKLGEHLQQIDWMLTRLAEASFQLVPSEGGINAVAAVWSKQGKQSKDDPEGVLFLSDQRVLFEQNQEIATKKVLFIATEKQKVQKLLLDVPVAKLENAKASKQGFLSHEDHLDLNFAAGAPVRSAHFHINGQACEQWQALLGRAKARDFDRDRAVAIDTEQIERVKAAPTHCPNCGSPITQTVLRGMDSLKCEYCGNIIRL